MSNHKIFRLLAAAVALTLLIVIIIGYNARTRENQRVNPEFAPYISAFTSGLISSESSIIVRLASDYEQAGAPGDEVSEELFDFSPGISGKTYWDDKRTLRFKPDAPLPSGVDFTASFYISKLLQMPQGLETFEFYFTVIEQSAGYYRDGFKPLNNADLRWYKAYGFMSTSDVSDNESFEKIFSAKQNGKNLSIKWTHNADRKKHDFVIDSIERTENEQKIIVTWDGAAMNIKGKGSDTVTIPGLKDFRFVEHYVEQNGEQYLRLLFSDPLLSTQNLDGLIRFSDDSPLRFIIEDNEARVYPASRLRGVKNLIIEPGIKNSADYKTLVKDIIELRFEELKPAVRLLGEGVILPNSSGLIFPFEAVNLSAVDVKVIRIYENNIAQFLQVNGLDGTNQLKRVGRTVFKKKVDLKTLNKTDYGKWNAFSLDLAELIETEPGAIYKIELSFKQDYSLYTCEGDEKVNKELQPLEEEQGEDEDDYAGDYYYDDYYYNDYYEDEYYYEDDYSGDYEYNQRDNPCNVAYYNSSRKVSRNILASDLGIIAKAGSAKTMSFAITDLRTTNPLPGITLEVYDFQQQLITSVKTNNNGTADVEVARKPFLLIAKNGRQRGYLKLDDGSSLSLSKFDISGQPVQKGLKGFIYGERGVWRPGDSLYLVFILEDKEKTLPANHPVTLDLINPQGQIVKRLTQSTGVNGIYNLSTATDATAPTGTWTANVRVGGALFTKNLRVEAIKPNRLKVKLDFGTEMLSVGKPEQEGTLLVKWLHGATARNLRASVAVTLTEASTSFEKFKEYVFTDPGKSFSSEEQIIFDAKINEKGEAKIKPALTLHDAAPGMLRASFVNRVFEEGGDFSIDRFSIPYSPYECYVGVKVPEGDKFRNMLFVDSTHTANFVSLSPEGKPLGNRQVQVEIYKVQWSWWWESANYYGYYAGNYNNKLFYRDTITTDAAGKGKVDFKIDYPEWGRFIIRVRDVKGGHSAGKDIYLDWPGWASRSYEDNSGANILSFSCNKDKYNVGELATITIPTGAQGRALVSIESGKKVVQMNWVEAKKGETTFQFKITPEMAPNVYAHVTLLQPHSQTANDLPIRMYGVIPIFVEDPNTILYPEMSMPEVLAPEQDVTIKVKEKNGKAMTYTIAVVDEGLLDLTRFKTPDPWSSFYAREALGVRTWDMYDLVLGAYGGKIEQAFAIGGDEGINGKGKNTANRFKPVVKFLGPFKLEKGKSASHTYKMPNYVGSVRTMIIAGQDGAYGTQEKTTPVRKPVMVLATLPRVVGPGESVKLPVTVFAMEKNIKNVKVEVTVNGKFIVNGSKTQTLTFAEPGDEVIMFDLDVVKTVGVGKVKVVATSGNERAEYNIEIEVRNPNPKHVDYVEAAVEAGKTWESAYALPGVDGTNKGTIEFSNMPPLDLGRRLQDLIGYPHGCVEQTTSAVFPQLFLSDVMELDNRVKPKIEENIKAAIHRLRSFQYSDGGLSYWPNGTESSDWGTSYAGHFLLEAEAKGYSWPEGMKAKWKSYQSKIARNWSPVTDSRSAYYYRYDDNVQAYRLYTLALAKAPELSAMNRLRERPALSQQARWRLAAAYVLAGQPEVATQLVKDLNIYVPDYNEMAYSYGSGTRDEAMILETMVLLNRRNEAIPLMKKISAALSAQRWMSTQETSYCLIAMSKFAGTNGTSSQMKYQYVLNGTSSETIITKLPVSQVDMKVKGDGGGKLKVINQGEGVLYVRMTLEGIPAAGNETSAENNLKMNITYKKMNGEALDISRLEQGTDFIAEVSITNPSITSYYQNMALSQVFPSGWEIHNTRMDEAENVNLKGTNTPTYQDVRDDRVYTYFNVNRETVVTYRVLLNAAYLGEFYLPAQSCEAMYDGHINARKAGKWVKVVRAGDPL